MDYRAARGMRDILPADIPAWERLESVARGLARRAGYREIRPPLLEETQLFIRSVGEVTDIVEKEMFTVAAGDGSLTLRPEATAGIVRAYVQAGFARSAPLQRLFTIGPMFRYERPQKGRERQFTQFDVECIGSLDPRIDAEMIHMAARFFEELGIEGLEVRLNSLGDGDDRDRYREAVREYVRPQLAERCDLCRSRFERNVLRVLDCKTPHCVELNKGAPKLIDFLSGANRQHFDAVRASLAALGRSTVVDPGIVRGLDYYTRTIFELHYPKLGARSALCGGGRYDHLVRDLGGPDVPAVGFAVGFSSTLIVLAETGLTAQIHPEPVDVFVVAAGEEFHGDALALAQRLRDGGLSAVFDVEARSVKSQIKLASSSASPLVAILGENERASAGVQLKDMRSGEQNLVPLDELVTRARAALGRGARL
jgi:histidyl-tRNA synthetase